MENQFVNNTKVIVKDINDEMRNSFLQYSMAVIVSRALPDVRDGLKPVHRRILYTLHENGLTPDKAYRKCADTVGSVLGRYHPHGDASVYDALVRLAQTFSMRYPLIDGHGNFGSVDGDPPAAYRYTEAKMSKISVEMLTDINKETVPFQSNYDDRLKEPVVLPSRFPNLLCNGSVGIAVGMATNIPPHNLNEVVDAMKLLAEDPDATLEQLMECIKGPDFPTGGIIMGKAGIRAAYGTGRGKIILRADTSIEEIKGRNCILVHELPYMVNKARLLESIGQLHKDKRIEGIHALRDESGRQGMRIVIELNRDANPEVVLNKLFSYTQLQDTVGVIMLALVNGVPKVLTLKEMLNQYIDFQAEIIENRTRFELKKAQEREHILEGLAIALDFIDEVIEIMKASASIPEGKSKLMERFGIDDVQAEAIVQMTIGRLTGLEKQKILDEMEALKLKIADLLDILGNHKRVLEIVIDEVSEIQRKFGDKRRTRIEDISGEVDIEDLIPVEEMVVTYSHNGYIKRMPISTYKAQRRGGKGISGMKQRDEDFVEEMFTCSTHDHILFISDKGLMYKIKCYEIPEGSRNSRGTNVINLIPVAEGDRIRTMIKTSDFDSGKFIVMVTKNGKIKRTALEAYRNVRRNGLIAVGLDDEDELRGVLLTDGSDEIMVATRNGMAIRIREQNVRPMARTAHGVRVIKLREGDSVVSLDKLREGASVLTVSEKGLGRRSSISDYSLQNRGGLGRLNYRVSEEKGHVCGIRVVDDDQDVIMISSNGVVIRIRACDVRIMGRYAKGVRVMKVGEGERVVAFTSIEHDEEAEIAEVEKPSEEELAEELVEPMDEPEESGDETDGSEE